MHILKYRGYGLDVAFCGVNTVQFPHERFLSISPEAITRPVTCARCLRAVRANSEPELAAVCGDFMAHQVVEAIAQHWPEGQPTP